MKAFQHVLERMPSPVVWNNIAYMLAEHDTHLDQARQYAENAVHVVEAQLEALSVEAVNPMQAGLMTQLANFWDTLGWVLFKQGDSKGSEDYLSGAWWLSENGTNEDHLGQIYEKKGRRADAIHAYELALASGSSDSSPETKGRLAGLIGGEKKVGDAVDSVRAELSARRTVDFKNPQDLEATAEFWLVLAPGPKVEGVKFISGDQGLRSFADQLRDAKFSVPFPTASAVKFLIRGVLTCSKVVHKCDFVRFPAGEAFRSSLSSGAALQQVIQQP
jgi:hypothetical protein